MYRLLLLLPFLVLPLVVSAQNADVAVSRRRAPHLALKTDLARPFAVNAVNSWPLNYYPIFRWPVLVSAEVGFAPNFSLEISGLRNGGVRRQRINGVVGQVRWYSSPPEELGNWELKPYFGPLLNYRKLQDFSFHEPPKAYMGGAGAGGGIVLCPARRRLQPQIDFYTGIYYQKRLNTNRSYGYHYNYEGPEDGVFSPDFFANRLNYDVRLSIGLQL